MSSHSSFQPPFSPEVVAAVLAAFVLVWIVLRLTAGGRAEPARRFGLFAMRAGVVLALLALLTGPVRVDEAPGPVRRPDVFILMDGSQSMNIGSPQTRWDEATAAVTAAMAAGEDRQSLHVFRFGHRLAAVEGGAIGSIDSSNTGQALGGPTDSDTRLADALRQLSGRFGRQPPAAVVLLSDGRARDAAAVEQTASYLGGRGVPIHVLPLGDTGRGGDVAVVSVVAPPRVRKYSEVAVQVFLRSFGYSGRRAEVQLIAADESADESANETADGAGNIGFGNILGNLFGASALPDGGERVLASLPITLRGGAQSVTLTYRSGPRGERLIARIQPLEDEVSTRNNELTAEVDIDRTKIRVLYIEGGGAGLRTISGASGIELTGPFAVLEDALTEDEDIECVTLVRLPATDELLRVQSFGSTTGRRGFPETLAELSAFDCIILDGVPASVLTDEQLDWLAHWVENRGGGLCVAGGADAFTGGWENTRLAELLPVGVAEASWDPTAAAALSVPPEAVTHSVWQIVADRRQNAEILQSAPPIEGLTRRLDPKPLTDVLATAADGEPALVAGRYGRGRTLALAMPASPPAAERFLTEWGASGNRYAAKFWRNVVYWLSESSSIGRRRLTVSADKRFYRPGETVTLSAVAYDETARRTTNYSVWAMIEPQSLDFDAEDLYAPVRWPDGLPRESGEEGPRMAWGEEFELPQVDGEYRLPLELTERLRGGASDEGLRVELTAYEGGGDESGFFRGTQVDSTSLDLQILADPFEQQNPFPNHDLLRRIAAVSGGRMLDGPDDLAAIVKNRPVETGPPIVSTVPLWDRVWILAALISLLALEWGWRRLVGLA